MVGALLLLGGIIAAAPAPARSPCTLHAEGKGWRGSCAALIEGATAALAIAPAPAITSGVWQRDEKPTSVWAGTIATAEYPASPIEIEVYAHGHVVMRTAFGWFNLSRFAPAHGRLRFDVDVSREAAPSAVDREIVERARRILSSDAAWNRADNRKCPASATTWSIYCAMEKATIEVAGAFHHRRPALQVVRAIVDERTAGRPYEHRLMDYNNDPTTRLADVQSLFTEALARIGSH